MTNFMFSTCKWQALQWKIRIRHTSQEVKQLLASCNPSALAMDLLQSCTKPQTRICIPKNVTHHWLAVGHHYCDVIMCAMMSQITSLTTVCSIVHSGADQRKHQSSSSLALGRGIHRWPVNSPHKWPVTRKMIRFDDVIILTSKVFNRLFPEAKTTILWML